jgi:hypothetical protein
VASALRSLEVGGVAEHPLGFSEDWQVTTVSQCLLGGQPVGTNRVPATVARLTVVAAVWSRPGLGDAQVSSQQERAARNESTTRQINEDIEQAHQGASPPDHVRILCECGWEDCDRVIAITLAEYESVRADPRQFAVAHDHVLADLEQVGAETDRYAVVAKREGTPAAVAVEEDPRG